jgi:hypothetical protein
MAIKKAGDITNPYLHQLFMSQTTIEAAARMLLRAAGIATEDDDDEDGGVSQGSLRRRSFLRENEEDGDFAELSELIEEFSFEDEREPVVVSEEIKNFEAELDRDLPPVKPEIWPSRQVSSQIQQAVVPRVEARSFRSPMDMPLLDNVQERNEAATMDDVMLATQAVMTVESTLAAKGQAKTAALKLPEPQEEASVMDGDYGRWKPATAAVGSAGKGLAAAISKSTGKQYKFHSEGAARSSDVGSDLWFEIEPKDSGDFIYFLGVKIKGDKEDPTWDVMLKKGEGMGTATSVASERGLKTSELKGAVGKLKSSIRVKKEQTGN